MSSSPVTSRYGALETETRICPRCKTMEPVGLGEKLWPTEWKCRACGEPVFVKYGIPHYAPDLADTSAGFNTACFDTLPYREAGHFWFEPRNRLLLGLAERYFPSAHRYLEIGCGTGFVLAGFAAARAWSRLVGGEIHSSGLLKARARLDARAEFVQ